MSSVYSNLLNSEIIVPCQNVKVNFIKKLPLNGICIHLIV